MCFKGPKGDTGPQGIMGIAGATGPPGPAGDAIATKPINAIVYVDDEVANDGAFNVIAIKTGANVSFQIDVVGWTLINESKDNERFFIEFEDAPSGYAALERGAGYFEDNRDRVFGQSRWVRHPDLNRWMVAVFVNRVDGSPMQIGKRVDFAASNIGLRAIGTDAMIGGSIILPPGF